MKQFYKILVICITFSFLCQSSSAKGAYYRVEYGEKPPTLTYGTKNEVNINPTLKDFLKKFNSPRVAVRFINPNKEEAIENIKNKTFDDSYYDYIEEELSIAGFQVVDHKLLAQMENTSGTMDYNAIKKKLNIDLVIEVSWLQFGKMEAEVIDFDAQKMILQYRKNFKASWENVGYVSWDGDAFPTIDGTISALFKIVMTSSSVIGGTVRTCVLKNGATKVSVTADRKGYLTSPIESYGWSSFSDYLIKNYGREFTEPLNQKLPYKNYGITLPSSYYDKYKPLTNLFCQELASFRK